MSARRYATWDEMEPDLPLWTQTEGEVARDKVLDAFEQHRATVVAALRAEAHRVYRRTGAPVSANHLRPMLERIGYNGDRRILIAAFRGWKVVGMTTSDAKGNHARKICLFEPPGQ